MLCETKDLEILANSFLNDSFQGSSCMLAELARVGVVTDRPAHDKIHGFQGCGPNALYTLQTW